jgi:hypothetical protein
MVQKGLCCLSTTTKRVYDGVMEFTVRKIFTVQAKYLMEIIKNYRIGLELYETGWKIYHRP